MWFHFCLANHDPVGRATLQDMFVWLEAGLTELGHRVSTSPVNVERAAINIFWENFLPGWGTKIRETEVRYGILATEIPDGDGFNWRRDDPWPDRWRGFPAAAAGASFIWTMVEETVPFYSRFAPTAYVELGFSEKLIPHLTTDHPDIDFSFFGLRTPYRLAVVEKLRQHARVEWPEGFLSAEQVNDLISRSRIGLSFKQSDQWPVPSPTRLGRLLMARRGIAAEHTRTLTRQGSLVPVCPEGTGFAEFAMARLGSNWRRDAEDAMERYRLEMPMSEITERILEGTVAANPEFSSRSNGTGSGRIRLSPLRPPMLVETCGRWNVVYYDDKYYGFHQGIGERVDLTIGDQALRKCFGTDEMVTGATLERVKREIDGRGQSAPETGCGIGRTALLKSLRRFFGVFSGRVR